MKRKLLAEAECSITLGDDFLLGAEAKGFLLGSVKAKSWPMAKLPKGKRDLGQRVGSAGQLF